jgi:hypothetical protein
MLQLVAAAIGLLTQGADSGASPVVAQQPLRSADARPAAAAPSNEAPSRPQRPRHAYYKLSRADVANTSWPMGFEHYTLFVANPGFTRAELTKVHTTVPGSQVLAYSDMSWAYVGVGCSESNGNFSQYFKPEWAITNLHTKQPVCPFGASPSPLDPSPKVDPVAAAVLMQDSALALVRYHKEVTLAAPYDGLYLDDFELMFPASWVSNVVAFTNNSFDTNGDGQPDTVASLQAQYAAWKPYYSAQLRAALGPEMLLLANTGSPAASDAALDGQTIEFEWCTASRGGLRACIAELEGQHAISSAADGGRRTPLSVMWLTDAKALPAESQCTELRALQKTMPWLLAGLDRSDLTWPANASCTRSAAAKSDDDAPARSTSRCYTMPVQASAKVVGAHRVQLGADHRGRVSDAASVWTLRH